MEDDDAVSQTRFSGVISTDSDHGEEKNTEKTGRRSQVIESRKTYRLEVDLEVLEEVSNEDSEVTR